MNPSNSSQVRTFGLSFLSITWVIIGTRLSCAAACERAEFERRVALSSRTMLEPPPPRSSATVDGVLLLPGAGGNRSHHTFLALEDALAPLRVDRRDFSYRANGMRPPPRPPVLIDDLRAMAQECVENSDTGSLVLGGRSMGGKIASLAVADGMSAAGLILLSYPLHPQGKPLRLRTEHFPDIRVPCLFISGTRDPFGSPDEFAEHLGDIRGAVTMIWLEGQRHDPTGCDALIIESVRDWLATLHAPKR